MRLLLAAALMQVAHMPPAAPVQADAAWVCRHPVRWFETTEWVAHLHLLKPKGADLQLVGAASPSFKSVRLLDWGYGEGLDVMTPTTPMKFWKDRCLDFTPEGKDLIQLQGPTHAIQLGEVVPIVLTFSDGSRLTVRPKYQKSGPEHAADHPLD